MPASDAEFMRFARWALPLRSNATRGVVAEWLVATATGANVDAPRDEWGNHDVVTPDGITIEVKSSAYLQVWGNPPETLPAVRYSGLKARWLAEDGMTYVGEPEFRSDVYVFALHTTLERDLYDLFDADQWEFRVVPRARLAALDQRGISLARLRSLGYAAPIPYANLAATIVEAAAS